MAKKDAVIKFRATSEDRERLNQLADAHEESAAVLLRKWIREEHAKRFGEGKASKRAK